MAKPQSRYPLSTVDLANDFGPGATTLLALVVVDQRRLRAEIVERHAPQMVVGRPVAPQRLHVRQNRLVLLILRRIEIRIADLADQIAIARDIELLLGDGV